MSWLSRAPAILVAVVAFLACASRDDHFAASLELKEAVYPEAWQGPKPISARQALRSALQSLEQRGVTDVRICRINWIVAGYGAAIVQATGCWQKDAVSFNAFAVAIADGTEVQHGHAGGDELWVIARGVDKKGAETYYDSAGSPTIQYYSEIAKDPNEGFMFEVVSREELAALPFQCSAVAQQLRRDMVKLCNDLKAAYDAGDRAKVLSHFQQTPTEAEYSMLGQLRFWEMPIKEIQTEEGVIRVTFTMDPQSDSPAQFLTLDFVRAADGKLTVKSSATPQQHESPAALARELQSRAKIERWPLLEQLVCELTTVLPADAQVFAFAEIYRGDEAMLLACASISDSLTPSTARFERKDGAWSLQGRFARESEIDAMLHAPEVKIVRRQAGLPLDEQYPQAESLEELRRLLQPRYMPAVPLTDAWRTPIRFEVSKDRKGYRLISAGADRKFNPESWAVANQELTDFAEDAVFEYGAFVRMWRTSD